MFSNASALSQQEKNAGEALLSASFDMAQNYDGTETSWKRVIAAVLSFSNYSEQLCFRKAAVFKFGEDAEKALSLALRPDNTPVSAADLLVFAKACFYRKLDCGKVSPLTLATSFRFLPAGDLSCAKAAAPSRNNSLIYALNLRGIYTDDIIIYESLPEFFPKKPQAPYMLFQIPRIKREVLISDDISTPIWVCKNKHHPSYWDRADERQKDGVLKKITAEAIWLEQTIAALFTNNPKITNEKPKTHPRIFQLNAKIIFYYSICHAFDNDWRPPTKTSGAVKGLNGQIWSLWDQVISDAYAKSSRSGLAGLERFWSERGLTNNKKGIETAYKALEDGIDFNQRSAWKKRDSYNSILVDALEHAHENSWKLPIGIKEEGLSKNSQRSWIAINCAIRNKSNGLPHRQDIDGLKSLFMLFGLRSETEVFHDKIKAAYERMKATGDHGLQVEDISQNKQIPLKVYCVQPAQEPIVPVVGTTLRCAAKDLT